MASWDAVVTNLGVKYEALRPSRLKTTLDVWIRIFSRSRFISLDLRSLGHLGGGEDNLEMITGNAKRG